MPHIHEKIDFAVDAIIVYQNTVLLRKHDKYKLWIGPGGHIELDEDPNEAVIREVKEEVGLEIELVREDLPFEDMPGEKELVAPRFMNRHQISATHTHVALTYFARAKTNVVVEGEQEKSGDIRWFTKEQLTDPALNLHPHIRHYALTALAELGS